MKSAMQHQFAMVPQVNVQRSLFKRDSSYKTTFNEQYLIPIYVDEVLPGDTKTIKAHLFARMATPVVPIMDNLYLETFWFFCPNRLLWDHWENFMGAKSGPSDTTEYIIPTMESFSVDEGSISDYFGLPIGATINDNEVSALPYRMYARVYDEWFKDQNLQDNIFLGVSGATGDAPQSVTNFTLQTINKRHDYFTSCLPDLQKGDAVTLPLGSTAPVIGNGKAIRWTNGDNLFDTVSYNVGGGDNLLLSQGTLGALHNVGDALSATTNIGTSRATGITERPAESGLIADLASATAPTINTIREAFQLQRMLERDMRSGTRYIELLYAHFGVINPDFRLQRSEFITRSSTRISINPVQQTSVTPPDGTGNATPMGSLAAFGQAYDGSGGFSKSFTEHGYLMCLAVVRGDNHYMQGINRMWSRKHREEFYFPALAHLGEQAVLNKEIYYQGGIEDDEKVFGYQERWAEYRYKPSIITGKFSSLSTTPLDVWHVAKKFASKPVLGPVFLQDPPDVSRVVAVPSEPHFLLDAFFEAKEARCMPTYSVPGYIDHF